MDARGRATQGAVAEGRGEGKPLKKPALILDRLFPTRSTASIPGGVSFSHREKGPCSDRNALFTVSPVR
jgi:hypothetical protein